MGDVLNRGSLCFGGRSIDVDVHKEIRSRKLQEHHSRPWNATFLPLRHAWHRNAEQARSGGGTAERSNDLGSLSIHKAFILAWAKITHKPRLIINLLG